MRLTETAEPFSARGSLFRARAPLRNMQRHTSLVASLFLSVSFTLLGAEVAAPTSSGAATFVAHTGQRLFGRGYWQISGNYTLAEAQAKCLAEPQCEAITFEADTPSPPSALIMWLTADVKYFPSPGWQSYTLNGSHPPSPPPPPPPPPVCELSSVLGSHMVLQRAPAQSVVWGFAMPGTLVTTVFGGAAFHSEADSAGVWRQRLPATKATAVGQSISFNCSTGEHFQADDVLFGEVAFCSGQVSSFMLVAEVCPASVCPWRRAAVSPLTHRM